MRRSSDFPWRYRRDLLASLPDDVTGEHRIVMRDQAVDDIYCMMRLEGHWPSDSLDRSGPNRWRRHQPSTRGDFSKLGYVRVKLFGVSA